eukprot:7422948-Pyramimonas_sp.AAC.1
MASSAKVKVAKSRRGFPGRPPKNARRLRDLKTVTASCACEAEALCNMKRTASSASVARTLEELTCIRH